MGSVVYLYYVVYNTKGESNPCDNEEEKGKINELTIDELTNLWEAYAPAIIVSGSNVIFPIFFELLGNMERYQFQSTRINITMARSFLMKLFSIISYLYILYATIDSKSQHNISVKVRKQLESPLFGSWYTDVSQVIALLYFL